MATSKLSVLALPHPIILLPASRSTLPVSKEIGETLLSIIEESDTLPIVAAVPLTAPSTLDVEELPLSEWGTAARVLRLIKPPARNPRQPYIVTLHGLTRVRLIHTSKEPITSDDLLHVPLHDVEYPPPEKLPSLEGVEKFKQSALRLLDRLAKDSLQQSRKEGYHKITSMLDDIADARTPWMADVLVGAVGGEYNDKLAILSTPDAEARLRLATEIFIKQASISEVSKKIATAVDESLSKQQKEFFLRQQLTAIQRELHALQKSNGIISVNQIPSNKNETGSSRELDDDEQHEVDDLADLKKKD
jgi:ATP-dependent Lon protease